MFDENWLFERLQLMIPLWLSLSVHEYAHAAAARWLGDDTAERLGRLTLNPLAHIDPVGTVLLPLMGVPFGWARPVPVNPLQFRRTVSMRTGMMITAAAGPLSNVVIALISIVLMAVLIRFWPEAVGPDSPAGALLQTMIFLNVILAAFNTLPVPPLDGSRIVDGLLPARFRPGWESFCQAGPMVLAAVIILPLLMGISLFRYPMLAAVWVLDLVLKLLG